MYVIYQTFNTTSHDVLHLDVYVGVQRVNILANISLLHVHKFPSQ